MKLIADNYEEDHIHPKHNPHHLHPANVHHRSLQRGPPHANHRPPMDQVNMNVHAHTDKHSPPPSLGLFTQVDKFWALILMLLKLMQFHSCHPHHQSVVVGHDSIKLLLSPLLCVFFFNPITASQISYSYHLDKRPEGESCQMSVSIISSLP